MHAPADTTNIPIVSPFLPYGLFGFKHREDSRHDRPLEPEETILAILYDKKGQAEFVLTNRTEYGITYCADGINVRDEGCNSLPLTATGELDITRFTSGRVWLHPRRVWLHPHLVGGFSHQGQSITRAEAASLGWIQLDTPLAVHTPVSYHNDIGNLDIYNPLRDTTSSDSIHYHWCSICREHYTSEGPCHHTKWQEGCGAEDLDIAEARTSVHALLRILPPDVVQRFYEQLLEGTFSVSNHEDFSTASRSTIGSACSKTRKITWHELEIDHDDLAHDESDAEKLYWPGLAWMGSLDHPERKDGNRTKAAYALTLGWVYEFLHDKHRDRLCLSTEKLYLEIPAAKFDALAALDPNDMNVLLDPLYWLEFRQTDLDRTANTHQFLAAPTECRFIYLVRRRRKTDDYRSLTYLVDRCEPSRPKPRATTRYRIRLARCLDHNGRHPSTFDTYRVIR